MSRCVTGVPLPGWMFSAFMHDAQLAVDVQHVAFAHRACDNLDHVDLSASGGLRALKRAGAAAGSPNRVGAFYRPFPRIAKKQPSPCREPAQQSPWWRPDRHADRRPFLLARGRIRRALRALVRGAGLRRGRDRRPAGLARQRDPPACLCHRADRHRRRAPAALSAHLAGVRLQEAAGGGRGEDLHLRARLPQSRARRAAPPGVHHARVVSRATSPTSG